MKRYLKFLFSFVLSVGLMISPVLRVVSYADVNDLLIGTDSNALMTLNLDDEDYGIMPLSSVGTATNTIDWSNSFVQIGIYDKELELTNYVYVSVKDYSSKGMNFTYTLDGTVWNDDKYVIRKLGFVLKKSNLPNAGSYLFSMDVTSQFSYEIYSPGIYSSKDSSNASTVSNTILITDYEFSSGDFAVLDMGITLTNVTQLIPAYWIYASSGLRNLDFSCRIGFTPFSGDYPSTSGTDTSVQDYQSDVSSSLSDISSSLDSAAESLEYISTSQNLIIQGIDNVIVHISDQLYAFWDQLYNLIHLPTMDKMDEIITAIENVDLEIEVNLDGLKQSIEKMSADVQSKLQSTTDQITGGYDNSGINQDAADLDSSLKEYDEAEKNVLDSVNDSLNDFEFDSGFDEYKSSIQVFSDFLQALYDASGGFKVVINLSLMLSIAGIVIGMYRFKDGG